MSDTFLQAERELFEREKAKLLRTTAYPSNFDLWLMARRAGPAMPPAESGEHKMPTPWQERYRQVACSANTTRGELEEYKKMSGAQDAEIADLRAFIGHLVDTHAAQKPLLILLADAAKKALRDYRMSNMICGDGDPTDAYPLVDLLSTEGESIATGEQEIELMVDAIFHEMRAVLARRAESPVPRHMLVDRLRKLYEERGSVNVVCISPALVLSVAEALERDNTPSIEVGSPASSEHAAENALLISLHALKKATDLYACGFNSRHAPLDGTPDETGFTSAQYEEAADEIRAVVSHARDIVRATLRYGNEQESDRGAITLNTRSSV